MTVTKKGFLQGTLILTAAGVVVKVIGSLNWIILSRVLGGEGIGLYQMAFPIYLLALSISTAGIPIAISIMTAEKLARGDYLGAGRVFKLSMAVLTVSGLILSALMYFGAEWLIQYRVIRDPRAYYSLLALAPAIFFVTILSSFRGYLQGWQIMTPTAVSQIAEQLFRVAAMLLFASLLLPMGLEYAAGGASLGACFGAVAGLLVLLFYQWKLQSEFKSQRQLHERHVPQEPSLVIIKRLAALALPVSLSSIMLPIVSNFDLLIVPARLEDAGFTVAQATELYGYLTGMAVPLVNLFTIITAALATSLVPAISQSYAVGDSEQTYRRTATAMRLANIVTIPGGVGLWLLAEPIASMIYHAPQASESIKILAVSVFLLGIHQVTTGVLQGLGRTTIPVVNMGVAAVIKITLNWTLTAIPALGIKGASWATVADIGVAAILNIYFVYRHTGFILELSHVFKSGVAAALMGGVIYVSYNWVLAATLSGTYATLVAIVAGVAVYGPVLLIMGGIDAQDVKRVPMIGERLARWLGRLKK